MRIYFAFIIVLFFLMPPAHAQEEQPVDMMSYEDAAAILDQAHVRGFIWGLPASVIKEEENSIFVEEAEEGALLYVDTIRGMRSSVTYEFREDKLDRVRIFVEKKYSKPQERMEDFVKIKRDLDKRFGDPLEEKFKWKSGEDKKYPDQWGWTVYRGDLSITIKWQDSETLVTAYLGSPEPFDPVLVITYEDKKAKDARNVKKEENSIKITP